MAYQEFAGEDGEPLKGIPSEGVARKDAPETSKWAARSINPQSQAGVILAAYREAGERGLTDDEGEHLLGISPQSFTPRRGELYRAGYIVRNGERRKTRSGRWADVWVLSEPASELEGAA